MSYRKASQTYGIPKTTIMDRINGKVKPWGAVVPIEVEKAIAAKIVAAAERGFGISKKHLLIKV